MAIELDRLQVRIIGVLIEKQLTVPDSYPLTVNALVAGCNQKSNRDPQMEIEAYEVEGALRDLMDKGWVRELDIEGGRTLRYGHAAADQLGVEKADLAILSELMCRGPQAAGALKPRASRMVPFPSPAAVESRLHELGARPIPYVTRLPKRPREHAPRWAHLLGRDAPDATAAPDASEADAPEPTAAPPPPASPPSGSAARIEALEAALAALEARVARLEGEGDTPGSS